MTLLPQTMFLRLPLTPIRTINLTSDPNRTCADTTSVVGNVSVEWIRHTVRRNPSQPFFAYIAPKAAHGEKEEWK